MSFIVNWLSPRNKWKISGNRYVQLCALLNTILFNGVLFSFISHQLTLFSISGLTIALSVFLIVFVFNLVFMSLILLVIPKLFKVILILTTFINSIAIYYMNTYQVILDKTMIGNILNTRSTEIFELISPSLFLYVIVIGVIPSWLIVKTGVNVLNRVKIAFQSSMITVLIIGFLLANAANWLWIDKYAKILGGKMLPWSYIINTVRYQSMKMKQETDYQLLPLGKFINDDKVVVVLVIGETARAQNFHFYGYPRNTNPLLETLKPLVFNNTTACTTYTTGSLACMLSYDSNKTSSEPLPSYLTRMGVDVIWRANNWGEPAIKVTDYQKVDELKENCFDEGCLFDEVLLTGLNQRIISSNKQKIFTVLHTKGSHGPSYYTRYPKRFEHFTPVCKHEELSKCTQQELVNAYDNTILYTDYFLYKAIKQLETLEDVPVMLIYISDHGESLGENGAYLHGTPYMFAPDFQKKIPFLIWTSSNFNYQSKHSNKNNSAFSHANIFHTIIGALGIKTQVYDKDLDVLN
tara:strand:+ start:7284 stop:8849 length:1566 start_codon:yes stop_codon:yes gene_type:complete